MKQFVKKYQLWVEQPDKKGCFTYTEYDSALECFIAPKTASWYVTKRFEVVVLDGDEAALPTHATAGLLPVEMTNVTRTETVSDEETEITSAYLGGGTGIVTSE